MDPATNKLETMKTEGEKTAIVLNRMQRFTYDTRVAIAALATKNETKDKTSPIKSKLR